MRVLARCRFQTHDQARHAIFEYLESWYNLRRRHSGPLGARSQIAAQTDVDAIKAWLARFVDTHATFDPYRKETERLLLGSTTPVRKPLSSLTHDDLPLYQRFLPDPQPAQRRVSTRRKRPRPR